MTTDSPNIVPVSIEDEIRHSYLDYAMSVIIGRALPDVRDGLKPVHRRILYAMHKLGNRYNSSYKKSARVVGDVIGQYHPHGDSAVYDALVRLAQDFNMRVPLVDGQGNFGSVDGDPAAAMRYTEVRMARVTQEFLNDIDKDTVDWTPTFDSSQEEPTVLPTKVPSLLVNGSSGIAVGMSTNIPPHNLREVIDATIALIEEPELEVADLMQHVPGPDFPTAGLIYGAGGIREAYETGRGIIRMRARASVEEWDNGKSSIIVTELPYQVNKAKLLEQIAGLVRDKRIDGITDLRDESDRRGMRMVIELRRDVVPEVILNNLYKMTRMQSSFGIIMLAIVNGQPQEMSLKEVLGHFIDFRRDVTTRRTIYELEQAEARAHILEGLEIALDNLDAVIALIRASSDPTTAREGLMAQFSLSERQAQAILDMRLQKLTGLERDKILEELAEVRATMEYLRGILSDETKLMEVITDELIEVRDTHADERRTEILYGVSDLAIEDLIAEETMAVTLSHQGYVKRTAVSDYRAQRRGGKGRRGMGTKDEDFVEDMFIASTHTEVLVFSTIGKVYKLKVYELPVGGPTNRGKPFVQLLPFSEDEKVRAVLPIEDFEDDTKYVVSCTKNGIVKRTELIAYKNVHSGGIIGLGLKDDDEIVSVKLTEDGDHIFLASRTGQSIRFDQSDVRSMGRTAAGVYGMRFKSDDDTVVSMDVIPAQGYEHLKILTITERGFGKRTEIDEHSVQGRGGMGMIVIKTTERNGGVVGSRLVAEEDELMLITDDGQIIRTRVAEISVYSRNTQGVGVMRIDGEERLVSFARIRAEDLAEDEDELEEGEEGVDGEESSGEEAAPEGDESAEVDASDEPSEDA